MKDVFVLKTSGQVNHFADVIGKKSNTPERRASINKARKIFSRTSRSFKITKNGK
ncbi:hypothetical protein [Oenococcus oeni]|uniref:hypothetical protein n=1 Tax=Oenococcus oeni TaxID=1247 RepID=UPI0010B634D3|nr:hypothetical protein [Oenococcus oeni]SYW13325.1 hypothetical protein OENI_1160003 [Oenococcus oeni]